MAGGVAFLLYAAANNNRFLFLDHVNLALHELGHLLFCLFGGFICLIGGTVVQIAVPAALCLHFAVRGDIGGTVFCGLWSGESLVNVSVYMADARAMDLPLVVGGEHDWNAVFGALHLLSYDTTIALLAKVLGWMIMIAAVLWLASVGLKGPEEAAGPKS